MTEITETALPGVGVRHEFTTGDGERVAVLTHRNGRREIAVYDRDDPDACTTVLHLSPDDTRTLAELLGASQVSEAVAAVQQQLEGLAIDWLTIPARDRRSPARPSPRAQFRTRTGASIVAVVRGDDDDRRRRARTHRFEAGDVVVAVGHAGRLSPARGPARA